MIKTVSFAPPRSARAAKAVGKSASNSANAQPARPAIASATPVATQSARASSGSSYSSQSEEKPAIAPRRVAIEAPAATLIEVEIDEVAATKVEPKVIAPKKNRAAKAAPLTPATSAEPEVVAAEIPVKRSASKTKKPSVASAAETKSLFDEEPVEAAPIVPAQSAVSPTAEIVSPRIKRSRAPKDLAAQYGAASETEIVPRVVELKPAPRKRLTRAAKAARSEMLRPDDSVLQRLQQANAIEVKKPATRGRGWEFECGCCGRITRFQTPGAICQCGAIAVRE